MAASYSGYSSGRFLQLPGKEHSSERRAELEQRSVELNATAADLAASAASEPPVAAGFVRPSEQAYSTAGHPLSR